LEVSTTKSAILGSHFQEHAELCWFIHKKLN